MGFAKRAARIRESALSPANPKSSLAYAKSLTNLAIAHCRCNENDQATAALEKAIDILKSNHPEELYPLAAAVENLATVYLEGGKIDKAEPLFEQILGDKVLRSAVYRTVIVGALTGMATIASKRKDYKTAAALSGEAIAAIEGEADPNMFNLATGYNNLGAILSKCGRLDGGPGEL